MVQAKAQLAAAAISQRAQPRTRPMILIAEDSPDGLEMLSTLLKYKGYEVLSAQNGFEAVDAARANFPDLILIDLQLPNLDGFGVTRNLRRHPRLQRIPIIVLSGQDPAQYREPALKAGCTDYLLKPIDFDQLDDILNSRVPLEG